MSSLLKKYAVSEKQLADSTNKHTICGALQRVVEGDAAHDIVVDTLYGLTHKPGAERLLTDKTLRRLSNVLEHHSAAYKRATDAVLEAFTNAIEAEGMQLAYKADESKVAA
jgi:hypothetical protein